MLYWVGQSGLISREISDFSASQIFSLAVESADLYKDLSQFTPISLHSNLEKIYRSWTKNYKFRTTVSRTNRESKMPLNDTQTVHQKVREKNGGEWNP